MNPFDPENIKDIIALSPLQEGMLYHSLKDSGSGAYIEQLCLTLSRQPEKADFQRAWSRVAQANEMLRTAFRWEKLSSPVQIILKKFSPEIHYHRFTGSSQLTEFKIRDRLDGFDMRQVPFRVSLCSVQGQNPVMVVTYHHILLDGWSTGILLKEFIGFYRDPSFSPAQNTQKVYYKDFVRWIRNSEKNSAKTFWHDYLKGVEPGFSLSIKQQLTAGQEQGLETFVLDEKTQLDLKEFTHRCKCTEAVLFYSAWGILLAHYNDCNGVICGTTVSGRSIPLKGVENSVGLFINTLPLRMDTASMNTIDLVSRLSDHLLEREEFSHSSLVDIKNAAGLGAGEELFDSVVIVENYPLDPRTLTRSDGLSISSYTMVEMTHYDLNLAVMMAEDMELTLSYNGHCFQARDIKRLSQHFLMILEQCIHQPERAIDEFQLIDEAEREEILFTFNLSGAAHAGMKNSPHVPDGTILDIFLEQAERTPQNIALQDSNTSLSYSQLNHRTSLIAQTLRRRGIRPGQIVALRMHRSVGMVIHILAILKTGAAYLPIQPDYPQERADYIMADSNAALMLMEPIEPQSSVLEKTSRREKPGIGGAAACYIIYTSGTTGKPKGVVIEHRSVVNQLHGLQCDYPLEDGDAYLLKTPYVFDVSVTELFGWFWSAGRLAVLEAGAEKDPRQIIQAIADFSITHINFVPSLFNAFCESLTQTGAASSRQSLAPLKYIFLAGEALPPELVKRFMRLNLNIPLKNLYGPTETTIYGSGYSLDQWNGEDSVPIGKPVRNGTLYILDRKLNPRPIGLWGELYIGGANLARGYLNRPGLTYERFINSKQIPNSSEPRSSGRACSSKHRNKWGILYRTGDLARWTPDGYVQFLGRIDHQVKIRGYRIEPGEIESQLLTHSAVEESVVVPYEKSSGDRVLCAYIVSRQQLPPAEIKQYLSARLPDYMVPAHFILLDKLPLTSSGKINRRLLPAPGIGVDADYAPPSDEIEKTLVDIWAKTLEIDARVIGIDRNFFELGGHSLNVTGMIGRIQKRLQVGLPFGRLFQTPTIRGLAEYIRHCPVLSQRPLEKAEKQEYYPLSPVQNRLYLVHLMDPASLAYNMSTIINLQGELQVDRLREAFKQLVAAHESFRTSFHSLSGQPVQRIHDSLDFHWEELPLGYSGLSGDRCPPMKLVKNFIRPFNLESPPLLRIGFIQCNSSCNGLIVDMHHIIADGVSLDLMTAQIAHYYNTGEFPSVAFQYKDFVMWENRVMSPGSTVFERMRDYWLNKFSGDIPLLDLPLDFERPDSQDFTGGILEIAIGKDRTQKLKQLARGEDASLFMVLLALFNLLLSRLTNSSDILVGTGVEGRSHADFKSIIGMFVNTLVLRNSPAPEKSFRRFLTEVKTVTTEAMENQDYPFEKLVEQLAPARESGRNPLFDVSFQFNSHQIPGLEMKDLKVQAFQYDRGMSKFDLTLWAFEHGSQRRGGQDGLLLRFEYASRLFKPATIAVLARYYQRILDAALDAPELSIARLCAPGNDERKQTLDNLNSQLEDENRRMAAKYPGKSFSQVLMDSLLKHKHNTALQCGSSELSYDELNRRSDGMASGLRELGVRTGDRVGVNTADRMPLITAAVAILKSGGVFVPLDTGQPRDRLELMIRTVDMHCIIGDEGTDLENTITRSIPHLSWLTPGQLLEAASAVTGKAPLSNQPDEPVYIYYTSGSTGAPKAILGRASGLLHFIDWELETFNIDSSFRFSQLSAPGFDAFLRDVFAPLCSGGTVCIPTGKETLMDASKLLEWLEDSEIDFVSCVPGLFRLLNTNNLTRDSLPRLKVILFSGERISAAHLRPWFSRIGERVTLVNLWGTSETTLAKSFHIMGPQDLQRPRVPVGKPLRGAAVMVLDEHMRWLEPLVSGELYIRTPYRSLGYYNDESANRQRFLDNPYSASPGDLIHKTGDIGRILADGSIDLLGRADRQVKVRGIRIEPGEIESLLLAHSTVKEAAVIKKVLPGENELLCAFIMGNGKYEERDIIVYLEQKLPPFMVPGRFIPIERMPRTPNGKIDYSVLQTLELESASIQDQPPQSGVEKELALLWSEILKREDIGLNAHFFALGGNSLNIMSLISMIHRRFDVRIPLGTIFKNPTLQRQAAIIQAGTADPHGNIEPVEDREYYPLSAAQKRLYILNQLDDENINYNIPAHIQLRGEVDVPRLEDVFRQLISRHESLRTSFHMMDGQPVQRIHPQVNFSLDKNEPVEPVPVKPFDLSRPPLIRAAISSQGGDRYLLIVDMHHIITDGESIATFIREFMQLYSGTRLQSMTLRYRDFVRWQMREQYSAQVQAHESYWLELFKDDIPPLDLPCDFPRPAMLDFDGDSVYSYIGEDLTLRLNTMARSLDITLFMLMLGAYTLLLSKLSGQRDILVGTPTAGRSHAALQPVIGMFVNTLALRNRHDADMPLNDFLQNIKENTLAAFQHQDYQFQDLVEKLGAGKDPGRNPLFDAVFVLENMDTPGLELPGLKMKQLDYRPPVSKFDLSLNCTETGGRIKFFAEYRTSLFKQKTIRRFIHYFKNILISLPDAIDRPVSDVQLLTFTEKQELLGRFNRIQVPWPRQKTMDRLFLEQVQRTPGFTALSVDSAAAANLHLSYGELNRRANRLAHLLKQRFGVTGQDLIGLLADRSEYTVIAMLAILKAGAAYVPVDPEYPAGRIRFTLKDSGVKLLLACREKTLNQLTGLSIPVFSLDTGYSAIHAMSGEQLPQTSQPGFLAYVIYTSGSTGRPKGVMVEHRNLVRLFFNDQFQFDFSDSDTWTLFHSPCFDFSVWEMYGALLYGGRLVIPSKTITRDTHAFYKLLLRQAVTLLNQTPSAFYQLAEVVLAEPTGRLALRCVIFGGEALSPLKLEQWHNAFPYIRLINMFGITETTVHVTYKEIGGPEIQNNISNIGGPIPTLGMCVADDDMNLTPPGVSGQLCVGGHGVARGYLNRVELTASRFINDPFNPGQRLYLSGDLGRVSPQNHDIEYLGRMDFQVQLRGFRVETGEIQGLLLKHPAINNAVVSARTAAAGDTYLCAYFVPEPGAEIPDQQQLKEYLSASLPDYMIPSFFVPLPEIPLTANGKVDRRALPEPQSVERGKDNFTAPSTPDQQKMAGIWQELLNTGPVGIDDNFFDIGGHSLKVLQLVNALHKEFKVKLNFQDVFLNPTIRELSPLIGSAESTGDNIIPLLPDKEYYDLSYTQQRMWLLNRLDPNDPAFNLKARLTLNRAVEMETISAVVQLLADRHEAFRTYFKTVQGTPVQVIVNHLPVQPELIDISYLPQEERQRERERLFQLESAIPFQLDQPPLFRMKLLKLSPELYDVFLTMHHIITDGWSLEVLEREFPQIYRAQLEGNAPALEPLPVRYRDYAHWHNGKLANPENMEPARKFWESQLNGDAPVLDLPYDFAKTAMTEKNSVAFRTVVPQKVYNRLKEVAKQSNASLFMVLLAAFNMLLARVSGQETILIGVPGAARPHEDLKNVIGLFVNTLILKNQVVPDQLFSQLLRRVQDNMMQVLEHQDYPLELICSEYKIRYPELSVFFNMSIFGNTLNRELSDLDSYHVQEVQNAKFDIVCYLEEYKNAIEINTVYYSQLFKPQTIEHIMRLYLSILKNISSDTGKALKEYYKSSKRKRLKLNDSNLN